MYLIFSLGLFIFLIIGFLVVFIGKFIKSKWRKSMEKEKDSRFSVGFFHPYCNAGGGGERVLWAGLKSLLHRYPDYRYVIYTGDTDASPTQILGNVKSRFNIQIPTDSVEFIYLNQRDWVEAHHYPHCTLLCQSLGSIVLGMEALRKFVPDVYIDTMGYAFTLPIFKVLGRSKVGCYVHYPTISTDMLDRVSAGTEAHNNNPAVARSSTLTSLKLIYYRLFAFAYSWAGQWADVVMVNSSWTQGHIQALWGSGRRAKNQAPISKVYPPCDVTKFKEIPFTTHRDPAVTKIVSIAQFRPEKDHNLQLESYAKLRILIGDEEWNKTRLVLIGSCRNFEDKCRVTHLKYVATQLGIETNVDFLLNVSFEELVKEMTTGHIGIHTMWNEHFGIGVVECLAAGLITLANKSGGPLMDIIETIDETHQTGFLASSAQEYAETLVKILNLADEEKLRIQTRARESMVRFSDEKFSQNYLDSLDPILTFS